MEYQEQSEFNNVVETLCNMFGDVLSKDAICTVVESCDGDVNMAAEAVMKITSDGKTEPPMHSANDTGPTQAATENKRNPSNTSTQQEQSVTTKSTATKTNTCHRTGAVPKLAPNVPKFVLCNSLVWTDQFRKILTCHNQGSQILILMRGLPGSGKSYLANKIVEITIGATYLDRAKHIFSSDNFFMFRGVYRFDRNRIGEAHAWNQRRVQSVLRQGLSPVIVDNTNIETWEMEPYLRSGVQNGYLIEVVEPNTSWAKTPNILVKKNTHCVPLSTIIRMLNNYQSDISAEFLIKNYGLSYPVGKVPPVIRKIPAILSRENNTRSETKAIVVTASNSILYEPSPTTPVLVEDGNESKSDLLLGAPNLKLGDSVDAEKPNKPLTDVSDINADDSENNVKDAIVKEKRDLEIQKQLEEMEKVEQEWENGETWEQSSSHQTVRTNNENPTALDPKPPRKMTESEFTAEPSSTDNSLQKKCDEARQVSLFLPPWNNESSSQLVEVPYPIETNSCSTCMEIGDNDLNNPRKINKIITSTPRDINLYHVSLKQEKIPDKRKLDKSTTTNESMLTESYRCKNEEQHFAAFRKMFKNIPKPALLDIFDKCRGDVNWATDIVLECLDSDQIKTLNDADISDVEEETCEESNAQCNCLAIYDIVPDIVPSVSTDMVSDQDVPCINSTVVLQRKSKPAPSETSIQLKRQIEKNFVMSDGVLSSHVQKIRKIRHGNHSINNDDNPENNSLDMPKSPRDMGCDDAMPSTSTGESASYVQADDSGDEESISSADELEKTVNINVGRQFVAELDQLFGRQKMTYPDNILPKLNIPLSLLNELNAIWMESLTHQLDEQDKLKSKVIEEDAEFARQIVMKEAELALAGKEPAVPDFKEIMDMDFAISLYQKDVAEWQSKEPNDWASKLTRVKLCNMFPDTSPTVLSELLMAYNNNFQATVEVLLMSTGKGHILNDKDGFNKFVMEKEMERQKRLLDEEKKTLEEVEWPLLPKGEKVDMSVVESYRLEASRHFDYRNAQLSKVKEYLNRGMPQVACYYSDVAKLHLRKAEQASSMAALSLLQMHYSNVPNSATLDLHYLRVREAKESVDIFIDAHIQKLRETESRGVRYLTLFLITGRGLHSNGKPKIKPAVIKRLEERGLVSTECNPGLLTAIVCAYDKLTYQVQVPNNRNQQHD